MNKRNKKYKLNYLSAEFYNKYNSIDYPEIVSKENRPYMVILIQIENNTFAIPFRTNVKHNNCYKFENSTRETDSITGLDYSKAVIVNDSKYIGAAARINDAEYTELDINYHVIIKQFTAYVKDYLKFVSGTLNEFQAQKYKYTTLKYFHKELHIEHIRPKLQTHIQGAVDIQKYKKTKKKPQHQRKYRKIDDKAI